MFTKNFSSIELCVRPGGPCQKWVFDENPDFQVRLSAKKPVALGAGIEKLEAPSEVYNLIKKLAWDL
jgi:hypothetical protein